MNDISGVAKGSTTTLRVGLGWTYHEFQWMYSGMKLSDIAAIRLVINGQTVSRYRSLAELVQMNQYDGIDLEHNLAFMNPELSSEEKATAIEDLPTSGSFTMVLDRSNMMTRLGEQATAIGTGVAYDAEKNKYPVENFVIEVDVLDTATVVSPSLKVYADVSAPSVTGYIVKKRLFEKDAIQGDEFQIADLPKFGRINRIFFHMDKNDAIDKAKIEIDTNKAFERLLPQFKKQYERFAKAYGGKQFPHMLVINPTERGFSDEGLAVLYSSGQSVHDFRIILDMAKACHIGMTVEYLDQLGK